MTHHDLDTDDPSWDSLMDRIRRGKVTPFIGAAAAIGTLPTGTRLANNWAESLGDEYPGDKSDLTAVAQFIAVTQGAMVPKLQVVDDLSGKGTPDFGAQNEPHALLAELPLPIYITTNYDDYMFQALRAQGKEPIREFCRWNDDVREHGLKTVFDEPGFVPTAQQPVVFHLHGILERPESIVITEDDYLSFLVDISWHRKRLLPLRIQEAFTGTSLMFMGYGLRDWNFKVIFRALVIATEANLRRESVSVQMHKQDFHARSYLAQYMEQNGIEIFWGNLTEFIGEIRARLNPWAEPWTST